MEPIVLSQIIKATRGNLISGMPDTKISGISIDSRKVFCGDLFIALKGERFDGHSFLEEAFKKGAIGAIVLKKFKMQNANKVIIKVKDTLKALGEIAKIYRERFDIPVVAISGSNGKTTTKEMLSHILSKKFNLIKAKASYNNFVGVPLTLFEIGKNTQVVVLEMETNLLGGINRLVKLAKPLVGIVTNISDTHLEFLKARANVFREKAELIGSLPDKGVAVFNSDDTYTAKMKELAKPRRLITFGIKSKSDFCASCIEIKDRQIEFILNNSYKIRLNTIFYGNVYNALAAVAVAHSVFGLSLKTVAVRLGGFRFLPMRMELINFKDIRIINDSYNANPQSMQEALFSFKNINTSGRRIAVLGDMLELGQDSPDFHYQLGRLCLVCEVDMLVTTGNLARHIAKGAKEAGMVKENIFTFDNTQSTAQALSSILKPKDVVLIKGSRKMRMEEIVDTLCQR
jgi:UDP-N-acetylmuramoyl-tripeptide--D-alanyl-D-alanine ligase